MYDIQLLQLLSRANVSLKLLICYYFSNRMSKHIFLSKSSTKQHVKHYNFFFKTCLVYIDKKNKVNSHSKINIYSIIFVVGTMINQKKYHLNYFM